MSHDVDLQGLAVKRGEAKRVVKPGRRVVTRYALPAALILGFVSLLAWASRELVFPPTPVEVIPVISATSQVRPAGTPLFNAAGWIEPRPTPVRVAALAPGVVEALLVVEDQYVKASEPVAELIKDDARLSYQRALADLKLRQADLDEVTATYKAAETRFAQPVHLEASLSEAEAALASIETALKNLPFQVRRAEADYDAFNKVHQGMVAAAGVVAGAEIDIAKSKVESAKSLVDELHDRSDSLERERAALVSRRDAIRTQLELLTDETKAMHEARARIRAAKARMELGHVALAEAKLRLDRMTVAAPIDGRVFRLIAHPGTQVGGGNPLTEDYDGSTIVTMYRPDQLQVRVDVRFEDIPKVSLNQPVEIDNPALASPIIGRVLFISSEADIQKNTLQVKVAIPDPPSFLKPEMLVDVTFVAPEQENPPESDSTGELKLYIPRQVIHQRDDITFVWLADQSEGIARKITIQTGSSTANGLVEVVTGLTAASRIIAHGSEQLKDGERIQVTREDVSLGIGEGMK